MLPNSLIAGIGTYYFTNDLAYSAEIMLTVYIGQQFGRLATPDTDQEGTKNYQDYLTSLIDPYFSLFWFYLWWPYAKIIPHRSIVSHGIIIGVLVRLVYLFVLFSPIIAYFNLHNVALYYWDYTLAFFIGYCLSDLNHLTLDYIMPLRRLAEKYLA